MLVDGSRRERSDSSIHGCILPRTQVLLTKISQTCQSVRDIKERRKQLVFHRTSKTFKRTTSYSNPPDHNSPHSSTGGGGVRDDNAKKSSSSTSSSLGGTHSPDTPAHRDPTSPAPAPTPTSRSPSPDGCLSGVCLNSLLTVS